jgi:DDE superfamily endonuclease
MPVPAIRQARLWKRTQKPRQKHDADRGVVPGIGMTASMILDGAANGVAFEIYVEQILAPSLTAGQIVVMDNLSIHKGAKVRSAIEARGCQLLFLPSYSPDLSPTLVSLLQVEGGVASGFGSYTRSIGGSDLPGTEFNYCPRCSWLVCPLWLSAC